MDAVPSVPCDSFRRLRKSPRDVRGKLEIEDAGELGGMLKFADLRSIRKVCCSFPVWP
jgi:hypothetical protein